MNKLRIDTYKPTNDNWHPSYKLEGPGNTNLVCVSISELSDGNFRVMAWGNDDFGLEFDSKDRDSQLALFLKIMEMQTVDIQFLKDLGFYPA